MNEQRRIYYTRVGRQWNIFSDKHYGVAATIDGGKWIAMPLMEPGSHPYAGDCVDRSKSVGPFKTRKEAAQALIAQVKDAS